MKDNGPRYHFLEMHFRNKGTVISIDEVAHDMICGRQLREQPKYIEILQLHD